MSGFTSVTGLPGSTFAGALQTASFRGVPFLVDAQQVKMGRRLAIHEYPFRDGGWPEDMGRALRTYSFTGHILGDLAPVMQLALATVCELKGPGLLIHPTIGAVQVGVLSATASVHKEKLRVIEVAFEFVEASPLIFPIALIATAVSVVLLCTAALSGANSDLGNDAGPAATIGGPAVTAQAQSVVQAFTAATVAAASDASGIVGMATALPPPNADTTYGRYAAGASTTLLPATSTVATLQSQLATQRVAVAAAGALAAAAAASYSAASDMMTPLAAVTEAMRAGITDPAAQVRVLLNLAAFSFAASQSGTVGVGAAIAAMATAMTAACRRAALVSLAQAEANYQPISYDDAANVRTLITDALDAEITIAGDAGDDGSYLAFKQIRSAIARDLTVRGASLPSVVTVSFGVGLPSLTIAQRLYKDASRSDQIAAEADVIHPAFCPSTFQALAF